MKAKGIYYLRISERVVVVSRGSLSHCSLQEWLEGIFE